MLKKGVPDVMFSNFYKLYFIYANGRMVEMRGGLSGLYGKIFAGTANYHGRHPLLVKKNKGTRVICYR
jgi:hypothetical protein